MSYNFGRGADKRDGDRGRTWTTGGSGRPAASTRGGGRWSIHCGITVCAWARAVRDIEEEILKIISELVMAGRTSGIKTAADFFSELRIMQINTC
jgi:hypothetical protein